MYFSQFEPEVLGFHFVNQRGLNSFYFSRFVMHHGKGGYNVKRMSAESPHSFLSAHLAESHAGCGLISCSLWLFSVFLLPPNRFLLECVEASNKAAGVEMYSKGARAER